tara:strand:- start:2731 stop:3801 length:1071 start_codon:yes stop_codon:yes gene_type:complete
MKKLLIALLACSGIMTAAQADYTLIVPQSPGQGTSVWASIIAKGLSKFTDEPVVIRHVPGARDIPGFNEFHNKLRNDPKMIMVAHGGNGVSFLLDQVDYDYRQYSAIGMMNLDIVVGKSKEADAKTSTFKVAGGSGYEPDGAAMAMLACGPQHNGSIDAYLACWKQRVIWVNGVKGNEKRLGFLRGEFNTTRESPAAWFKYYTSAEASATNEVWYTHGVYDLANKKQMADANFPGTQFEDVYKKAWGELPRGELYEAYRLTRNWRDVVQKSLWVNKGNPNTAALRTALTKMLADKETMAEITRDAGQYGWIVGSDGDAVIGELFKLVTEPALKGAVRWNQEAYGFPSVFKPELLKK